MHGATSDVMASRAGDVKRCSPTSTKRASPNASESKTTTRHYCYEGGGGRAGDGKVDDAGDDDGGNGGVGGDGGSDRGCCRDVSRTSLEVVDCDAQIPAVSNDNRVPKYT